VNRESEILQNQKKNTGKKIKKHRKVPPAHAKQVFFTLYGTPYTLKNSVSD